MKEKMFKLPRTRTFGNAPKGKFKPGKEPIPMRKFDKVADHKPQTNAMHIPLPDKLRGK